jgi:hypothetical protein
MNPMEPQKTLQQITSSDDSLIEWLSLIGFIVISWSPVERSIDQCVHIAFNKFGGNIILKNKPRALVAKLEFIEKCQSKIPELEIVFSDINKLKCDTSQASQIRDICVHGILVECNSNELKISKVAKSANHVLEIFTIDYPRMNKSLRNIQELASRWALIADHLAHTAAI